MKIGILTAAAGLCMAGAAVAQEAAGTGLRLTYDMAGSPVTLTRDAAGTVQLDGLPYPGLALYVPATGVVYYQHPDETGWLTITPLDTNGYTVSATTVAGAAWQPYLDAPTRRWEVKGAQMPCDNWFASQKAGSVAGLTAADLWRVFSALQWLQAGSAAPVCDKLAVDAAQAAQIGLPLYFNGPGGLWQLNELTQAEIPTIALPATPQPVTDEARLRVLLHQFGPEDKEALLKDIGGLPVARQLEEIQKRLADTAAF